MKKVIVGVTAVVVFAACSSQPQTKETQAKDTQKAVGTTGTSTASGLIPVTTKSPDAFAHFRKGEALFYNIRPAEASEEFSQALRIDPTFVLARAYRAQTLPGVEGAREIEEAAKAAATLPEAERLLIQSMAASTKGDSAGAEQLLGQLTRVAPKDWRAHYALGLQRLSDQKYADAIAPLKESTELNADAAVAYNMLGYAALAQRDTGGAVDAFEQYARLMPREPNPQDSLGEALIAAGRFTEAEGAFNKALVLSPTFWNAHEGMAFAKIYAGDWEGGRAELTAARAGATTAAQKLMVDRELATVAAAQGKTAEALEILDRAERMTGVDPGVQAFIPVRRAEVLILAGKPRDAIAAVSPAVKTADNSATPEAVAYPLRRQALRVRATAESQLRDSKAAEESARRLEHDASAHPDEPAAQDAVHYTYGMLAMSKGDYAGARSHFDRCTVQDDVCKWQGVIATERAGDTTAATAARERLMMLYKRDPAYLMVRNQLAKTGERNTA